MEEKTFQKKAGNLIREYSAGGVVFKKSPKGEILWLLIIPSGTERWQFPKGKIDKGEMVKEAALREVEEEGGVVCQIVGNLGVVRYFFVFEGQKVFKTLTYFLMMYKKDTGKGHDKEVERAEFLGFRDALQKLTFKNDKEILKKANGLIEAGLQGILL